MVDGPDPRSKLTRQGVARIVWGWLEWAIHHPESWKDAGHTGDECFCRSVDECVLKDLRADAARIAQSDGSESDG